ncbi:MAG: hypothetical protein HYV93_22770 [Candidatus Rokubacteria bacterium]|nr:hypothetical protein [Candidatus Rokubacteria bacterium]
MGVHHHATAVRWSEGFPRGLSPYNTRVTSSARRPAASSARRRVARWAIGVDRGGTWVRARALSASGSARAARWPAAGPAPLERDLARAFRRWRIAPADLGALVVASRGVWTVRERRIAERRLAGLARRVRVIPDVEAAYRGALGEAPGVLLLAGTGSIALARDWRGGCRRAGGLGPLLGDEGSAFWIGREWLRATAGAPHWSRLRRLLGAPDAAKRIAALAPGVLRRARRGHRRARQVIAQAQAELARLLDEVTRGARLRPPIRVSWAGRLMDDPRFRAGVWRAARRRGLRIAPLPPRQSAVATALRLATALRC